MSVQSLETRRLLSAQLNGHVLNIVGTAGNDHISVAISGLNIVVLEDAAPETFLASSVNRIAISAKTGNDVVRISDAVTAPAVIDGGGGNDSLRGGGGLDQLLGAAGNDTLDGGKRADSFFGGAGNDTADYSTRILGVLVSLDDQANDGGAGEHDNVAADIETIRGGAGGDLLIGNVFSNRLIGNGGNDTLIGARGNDTLDGGNGDDRFTANSVFDGRDSIVGGDGTDTLDYRGRISAIIAGNAAGAEDSADQSIEVYLGGLGNDTITIGTFNPSAGPYIINGGAGNDSLANTAGNNELHGGDGNDVLINYTGAASLFGDGGNDSVTTNGSTDAFLHGGDGNDTFKAIESLNTDVHGDDGDDTLDCSHINIGGAFITIDDVADDRISSIETIGNSHSNVHSDIESIIGSPGNDTITGS